MSGIVRGMAIVEKKATSTRAEVDNKVPATIAQTALELMYLKTARYKPKRIKIKMLIGRTTSNMSQYWTLTSGRVESKRINKAVQKDKKTKTASTDNAIRRLAFLDEFNILIKTFVDKLLSLLFALLFLNFLIITNPCHSELKYSYLVSENK
jgi:deoxyribodipyrimidine photolyase